MLPPTLLRAGLACAVVLVPAVAFAGFGASSFKRNNNSDFGPQAALDGNPTTAWLVSPDQENEGSWIELDVPMGKVDKVSLIVGWAKDDESWKDHARLKDARIEVFDLDSGSPVLVHKSDVALKDEQGRQVIDLPDPKVGGEFAGGRVRVTVTGTYQGQDYAHMAMSELLVHMVEFDAATVKLTSAPDSEADGKPGTNMIDGDPKTFWASVKESPVEFRVDGGRYSVSSIGITPGPTTHGRPKQIELTQSDVTRTVDLPDKPGTYWFELPALVGYTGSAMGPVTVRVIDVYPGTTTKVPAISEVKFRATMLDAF